MDYHTFDVTTHAYEAQVAAGLRQRQLLAAAQRAHQPRRRWWTGLGKWITRLQMPRVRPAPRAEDLS